jgi:hypothetical protein
VTIHTDEPFEENDVIELTREGHSLIEITRLTGASIKTIRRIREDAIREGYLQETILNPIDEKTKSIYLSLLVRGGIVPLKSGLNWGLSNGHVASNDAYIPIRIHHLRKGCFLEHGVIFDAEWDDGKVMQLVAEGTQPLDGKGAFPKQMTSYADKSLLGLYLRSRIGVSAPLPITRIDLDRYGRNDIQVTFIEPSRIFLDFSVAQ